MYYILRNQFGLFETDSITHGSENGKPTNETFSFIHLSFFQVVPIACLFYAWYSFFRHWKITLHETDKTILAFL